MGSLRKRKRPDASTLMGEEQIAGAGTLLRQNASMRKEIIHPQFRLIILW